jgi:fructuronate reductase
MTEEVMPTLSVAGIDLGLYRDALIERFGNRGLRHLTRQIATDGSQKLPQRLLGTIRDRLAAGAPIDRLALAVAGWMTYLRGVDDTGRPHEIRDPLAPRLRTIVDAAGDDPSALYAGLTAIRQVFGTDGLAAERAFRDPVHRTLSRLIRDGAARTVASFI